MYTFGSRLRILRKRAGLTQAQLGQALSRHRDQADISRIEADLVHVSVKEVFTLADALGVTVQDFFIEEPEVIDVA